jgi:heme A synthase
LGDVALHLLILITGFALAVIAAVRLRKEQGRQRPALWLMLVVGVLIAIGEAINIATA